MPEFLSQSLYQRLAHLWRVPMAELVEEQLTVPLWPDSNVPKEARKSREWQRAIRVLLNDPRLKLAKSFMALPLPPDIEHGWYITRRGIQFRCLVGWVMFPQDGGPAGFRGRVDVRFLVEPSSPSGDPPA